MNDTVEKLLTYLPKFEAGEEITRDNWFMDFYWLVLDDFCDMEYPQHVLEMGWEYLTDTDYIASASFNQLKTILTAICHSERYAKDGEPWEVYVKAGSFLAILRRLAEVEKEA